MVSLAGGTPIDGSVQLHEWLLALAEAGHLDGFVELAYGPAFGAGASPAAQAARAWVQANPFRPSRAPMPDDLVPVQLPGR